MIAVHAVTASFEVRIIVFSFTPLGLTTKCSLHFYSSSVDCSAVKCRRCIEETKDFFSAVVYLYHDGYAKNEPADASDTFALKFRVNIRLCCCRLDLRKNERIS